MNILGRRLPKSSTGPLLTWKYINEKAPWSLIFLLGGAFAIAEGGKVSGMTKMIGNGLVGMKDLHPLLILFLVCVIGQVFTEFSSSVAVTSILLPVLAEMVRILMVVRDFV